MNAQYQYQITPNDIDALKELAQKLENPRGDYDELINKFCARAGPFEKDFRKLSETIEINKCLYSIQPLMKARREELKGQTGDKIWRELWQREAKDIIKSLGYAKDAIQVRQERKSTQEKMPEEELKNGGGEGEHKASKKDGLSYDPKKHIFRKDLIELYCPNNTAFKRANKDKSLKALGQEGRKKFYDRKKALERAKKWFPEERFEVKDDELSKDQQELADPYLQAFNQLPNSIKKNHDIIHDCEQEIRLRAYKGKLEPAKTDRGPQKYVLTMLRNRGINEGQRQARHKRAEEEAQKQRD